MVRRRNSKKITCWSTKYIGDKYAKMAKERNLRSRSWFKIDEIQKKEKLFHSGMNIIDLGSSPGGWSKYIASKINGKGRVTACDILPMRPIQGVDFLQGDLFTSRVVKELINQTRKRVEIVISDMSPNISGISSVDIPRSINLARLALDICKTLLAPGGNFLVKIFQGEEFDIIFKEICVLFLKTKIFKPNSSRPTSREVYIIAKGYNLR